LRDQLSATTLGYDAIAGTVGVEDWQDHGYEASYIDAYQASCGQHGALRGRSCARSESRVRASAYRASGGFRPLATGEDRALWEALRVAGRRSLATREIEVLTSARTRARAPSGFAQFLAERRTCPYLVPADEIADVYNVIATSEVHHDRATSD
jgi:hypothetical protein